MVFNILFPVFCKEVSISPEFTADDRDNPVNAAGLHVHPVVKSLGVTSQKPTCFGWLLRHGHTSRLQTAAQSILQH